MVEPTLTVPGYEDVFVIGDLASLKQADGRPVPGVAPAAMQMGRYVGQAILRRLKGQPLEPFRYHDKGSFAVIGRGSAVGMIANKYRLKGMVAWWMWLGIHITFLIGFRNKVAVMLDWAYTYFTKKRDVRLITGLHANRLPSIQSRTLPGVSEARAHEVEASPEHEPVHVH